MSTNTSIESRADQERAWVAAMKPGQEYEHQGVRIRRNALGCFSIGRAVLRDASEAIAYADNCAGERVPARSGCETAAQ